MDVEVHLAVFAEGHVMVIENRGLPRQALSPSETSKDIASELFRRHTDSEAEPWLTIRQVGFVDREPKTVLYAVDLPEKIPLLGGARWMTVEEIMEWDEVRSLCLRACRYD